MNDDDWTDEDIAQLHWKVCEELQSLFLHEPGASKALLDEWLTANPQISSDTISHFGPFNAALQIHYELVERGDVHSAEYINWRKNIDEVWEVRRKPNLTPEQEAMLRVRGWNDN